IPQRAHCARSQTAPTTHAKKFANSGVSKNRVGSLPCRWANRAFHIPRFSFLYLKTIFRRRSRCYFLAGQSIPKRYTVVPPDDEVESGQRHFSSAAVAVQLCL